MNTTSAPTPSCSASQAQELACCEQLRKEDAGYIRELWDDNRRLHSELDHFNRHELKKV